MQRFGTFIEIERRPPHPTRRNWTHGVYINERTIMSLKPHDDNTQIFGVIWMDKRRKTGVWQDVHAVGTIWATRFLSIEKDIKRCRCQPTGPGALAQVGVPREKLEELVFLHKATADIGYIENVGHWHLINLSIWHVTWIGDFFYLQKKRSWSHRCSSPGCTWKLVSIWSWGYKGPAPHRILAGSTLDQKQPRIYHLSSQVANCCQHIKIKRWVPNLWTLEHLELEEQLVQLRAISWVSTRHSLQPQSPLVRLNPKVRAFKGVWGQTALWLATWHGTMIENSDSIFDIPVKWRCCMLILPWSPYMNWSFWEPWWIPTYG